MNSKVFEKEKSIILRKKGFSYRDILKEIPVSKSSLSAWLKDLPLTTAEKHYLKNRRDSNISLGRVRAASAIHSNRVEREKKIFQEAKQEFLKYKKDHFFQLGIALYWAEGAHRSEIFSFTNSDHEMVSVMLAWMYKYYGLNKGDINARLYIHKPYAHENCEFFWSKMTGIPIENFRRTIYKPTGLLVKKRPNYKGCIRILVGKKVYFCKIQFWQKMLVEEYKIDVSLHNAPVAQRIEHLASDEKVPGSSPGRRT